MIIKFVFKAIVVEAEEWNPEVKAPLRMDNASQVMSIFSHATGFMCNLIECSNLFQ